MKVIARISSKGQITLPREVRQRLGLKQGDDLVFDIEGDTVTLLAPAGENPFEAFIGTLPPVPGGALRYWREQRNGDGEGLTYALDTNILSALLGGEAGAHAISTSLNALRLAGPLVIHGSVYAELLAAAGNSVARQDTFLQRVGITVDTTDSLELWRTAGRAYSAYAARRQRSGGGVSRRLLMDFLVGAHAVHAGATLVTLDDGHYRQACPALPLLVP